MKQLSADFQAESDSHQPKFGSESIKVSAHNRTSTLDAVTFYPVTTLQDFREPKTSFKPLYTHQFFGLKEELHGFTDLSISIYYITDTLDVFVRTQGSFIKETQSGCSQNKATSPSQENITQQSPSIVYARIISYLNNIPYPGGIHPTEESFEAAILTPTRGPFFLPIGSITPIFDLEPDAPPAVSFEAYKIRGTDLLHQSLASQIHRRLEWYLHYYIDACSKIDYDANWTVQVLYKKKKILSSELSSAEQEMLARFDNTQFAHQSSPPSKRTKHSSSKPSELWYHETAGIITQYCFFALPLSRCRVSQFFIFPCYQQQSLGIHTLLALYREAAVLENVGEITVEDPAASFTQLRDCVGILRAVEERVLRKDCLMFGCDSVCPGNTATQNSETDQEDSNLEKILSCQASSEELSSQLKTEVKESPKQIARLVDIIELIHILPQDISSICHGSCIPGDMVAYKLPPIFKLSEKSREWRQLSTLSSSAESKSNEEISSFHEKPSLVTFRLNVKMRLRSMHYHILEHLPDQEQRQILWKLWEDTFYSYLRTICKVRDWYTRYY